MNDFLFTITHHVDLFFHYLFTGVKNGDPVTFGFIAAFFFVMITGIVKIFFMDGSSSRPPRNHYDSFFDSSCDSDDFSSSDSTSHESFNHALMDNTDGIMMSDQTFTGHD